MKNAKSLALACIFMSIFLAGLISEAFFVSAVPVDKDNLDKITFVHYKDGKVKAMDPKARLGTNTCYKLMGVKWTSTNPISYVINPENSGWDASLLTNAISSGAEEWDEYTSRELFNNVPSLDYSATFETGKSPDGKNSYVFGEYSGNSNVIAVTNVWYTRIGKSIVDYDVLFNTYYNWLDCTQTTCTEENKGMDVQNIATHETGHGIGLYDLYNACVSETMYGYSWEGDISKRDLNSGDIAGLRKIYG